MEEKLNKEENNKQKSKQKGKQKNNKSNKNLVIITLIVAIIAVVSMIVFTILATKVKHYEVREIPYDFMIFEYKQIGFHGGTDALHFGGIPANSKSKKQLIVKNTYDFDITVYSVFNDTYADWFSAKPDFFVLSPGEQRNITYTVTVPPDPPLVNASGFVYIYIVER